MDGSVNCPFTKDGPCYHRGPNGTCVRKPGEECLKPYRDGLKEKAKMAEDDKRFLKECAALFRMNDLNRADRLEQIANSINV